jgi:hypothetical protein
MPGPLLPHRARYQVLGRGGDVAGTEELEVAEDGAGWRIRSRVETTWPEDIVASIDWELDASMLTRLLRIFSRERFSGDYELELSVGGNGLLAHRDAPDGPTQVELGWGPNAELDYLSAAFPAVMVARSDLAPGASRDVDAVQLGTADLVPTIIGQRLVRIGPDAAPRLVPIPGASPAVAATVAASHVQCTVVDTGHVAVISTAASGALVAYSDLLRLTSLEPTK